MFRYMLNRKYLFKCLQSIYLVQPFSYLCKIVPLSKFRALINSIDSQNLYVAWLGGYRLWALSQYRDAVLPT